MSPQQSWAALGQCALVSQAPTRCCCNACGPTDLQVVSSIHQQTQLKRQGWTSSADPERCDVSPQAAAVVYCAGCQPHQAPPRTSARWAPMGRHEGGAARSGSSWCTYLRRRPSRGQDLQHEDAVSLCVHLLLLHNVAAANSILKRALCLESRMSNLL